MTRPASAPRSVCTAPRQSLGFLWLQQHMARPKRGQNLNLREFQCVFNDQLWPFRWKSSTVFQSVVNHLMGLSHSKFVSHPFTNASNIQWRTCKGRGAPQRGLGRKARGTSRNIIEIVDIYIYIMWIIWIIYNTMYIIVYMIIYVYNISIMMFTCFDSMCMYIWIFSDWGVVHHPKLALYTSTRPKLHITDDLNNHKRPYKYHECGWIK
jgi:hypothetical protein